MTRLRTFWEANFLLLELLLAIAVGVIFYIWDRYLGGALDIDMLLDGNRSALYATLASIFGALLGFVVTTVSIIMTSASDNRLSLVRRSQHYLTLWKAFTSAIRVLAVATIVAISALLLDRDKSPIHIITDLVAFSAFFAALRLMRCVWILERIVGLISKA